MRSLTLDKWSAPRLALIQQAGNVRANTWWEAKVDASTGQVTVQGKASGAAAAAKGAGSSRQRQQQLQQLQEITMTKPSANPTRAAAEVH